MSKKYAQMYKNPSPLARKHSDLFYKCPGAWVGSMPYTLFDNKGDGRIIIDPAKVVEAVLFLRRHYTILDSGIDEKGKGIIFHIQAKGA